jgi:hypothetical protein
MDCKKAEVLRWGRQVGREMELLENPTELGRRATTPKLCSCAGHSCGNPRHAQKSANGGGQTRQERLADLKLQEQVMELEAPVEVPLFPTEQNPNCVYAQVRFGLLVAEKLCN